MISFIFYRDLLNNEHHPIRATLTKLTNQIKSTFCGTVTEISSGNLIGQCIPDPSLQQYERHYVAWRSPGQGQGDSDNDKEGQHLTMVHVTSPRSVPLSNKSDHDESCIKASDLERNDLEPALSDLALSDPVLNDPAKHKYVLPSKDSSRHVRCLYCSRGREDTKVTGVKKDSAKVTEVTRQETQSDICVAYSRKGNTKLGQPHPIRTCLLESVGLQEVQSHDSPGCLYLSHGLALQRCPISRHILPQHYQLICMQNTDNLDNFRELCEIVSKHMLPYKEIKMTGVVQGKVEEIQDHRINCVHYTEALSYLQGETLTIFSAIIPEPSRESVPCNVDHDKHEGISNENSEEFLVFACVGRLKKDPSLCVCLFYIDLLAELWYNLP